MAIRKNQGWKPKDKIVLILVISIVFIIGGEVIAPLFTPLKHFEMLDEIIGATVSGLLLTISNYLRDNDKEN